MKQTNKKKIITHGTKTHGSMRSPGSDGNNVRPEVPGKHVIKRAMPYREKIALTMEKHLTAWKGQKKQGFFHHGISIVSSCFFH